MSIKEVELVSSLSLNFMLVSVSRDKGVQSVISFLKFSNLDCKYSFKIGVLINFIKQTKMGNRQQSS